MVYIVPHHHHPTTVTMSPDRRLQLLRLLAEYDFWLIEDDYDYDYHHSNQPILPLATSEHAGRIIYVGSFSKLLGSSFRMGFMVAAPDIIAQAIRLRRILDLKGDTYLESSIASLIRDGSFARHVHNMNRIYAGRCGLFCMVVRDQLNGYVSFCAPQGGMALWITFDQRFDLGDVIRRCAGRGLQLLGTSYKNEKGRHHNSLRVGFASLSEEEMLKGVDILRGVLK
jgi:GntR family transcriptional regulator/MocR family aminotransferase